MEYLKTLSRSRNEQSEYQVASTAESVFGAAAEPVRMDMGWFQEAWGNVWQKVCFVYFAEIHQLGGSDHALWCGSFRSISPS